MLKFRMIGADVEAIEITEEFYADRDNWPQWFKDAHLSDRNEGGAVFPVDYPNAASIDRLRLERGRGSGLIDWGDWLVRLHDGRLDIYTPDAFAANYEPA